MTSALREIWGCVRTMTWLTDGQTDSLLFPDEFSREARLSEKARQSCGSGCHSRSKTVDDPTYLNEPFVTSTHFKKEPDNSKFAPTPCVAHR